MLWNIWLYGDWCIVGVHYCYYCWIIINKGRLLLCVNASCLWSEKGVVSIIIDLYGNDSLCRVVERGTPASSKEGLVACPKLRREDWFSAGGSWVQKSGLDSRENQMLSWYFMHKCHVTLWVRFYTYNCILLWMSVRLWWCWLCIRCKICYVFLYLHILYIVDIESCFSPFCFMLFTMDILQINRSKYWCCVWKVAC